MHIHNYILVGASGSGKSTFGRALAKHTDLPYISSGDIARNLDLDADEHSALARGMYAPEVRMQEEVRRHVKDHSEGLILDGFPRKMEQLFCVCEWIENPVFVHIHAHAILCFRRIMSREREDDGASAFARKWSAYEKDTIPMLSLIQKGLEQEVPGLQYYMIDNGTFMDRNDLDETVIDIIHRSQQLKEFGT